MRGIRCAVAAILAAGIVTMVAAQPGGGFGGGFGFVQDPYTLVLTNAALQEEVKITAAQKEKFKPAADKQAELAKKQREMFGGGKGGKGGFDKEKIAEIQEEGKKVAEEVKKVLDAELTAEQKKRLKQIGVQQMGVNVFAEPAEEGKGGKGGKGGFGAFQTESQKATMKEVAETLKLTDAQKSKIKDIVTEHGKDVRAVRTDIFGEKGGFGGKQDPDKAKDFAEKSAKLSAETMSKIAEALDDSQKKAWKELTGAPFDLAKLRPVVAKKD